MILNRVAPVHNVFMVLTYAVLVKNQHAQRHMFVMSLSACMCVHILRDIK